MASLSRCVRWAQRGGKSNAYFAKTRDDRYIIKSMSKVSARGLEGRMLLLAQYLVAPSSLKVVLMGKAGKWWLCCRHR